MTFIYKLDLYSLEIYWMCKYELTSRLSKVIIWQTDRHAGTTEIHHAASRVVNENVRSIKTDSRIPREWPETSTYSLIGLQAAVVDLVDEQSTDELGLSVRRVLEDSAEHA